MTDVTEGRLLFVVSRDFGELNMAVSLAQEPAFASLVLIPPALYELHRAAVPVPAAAYHSPAEVLAVVERLRPDVVFLFSGYLFADNGVFANDDLARLVKDLRARGCRIVTTDPFLGLAGQIDAHTFDRRYIPSIRPELFAQAYAVLKDCPHLYTADARAVATTEALAYSHRALVRPPELRECPAAVARSLGLDPDRPRWAFVLGSLDFRQLTAADPGFVDLLADQLYEVHEQGRQAVLVAPEACTSAVALRSPPAERPVLVPFCRLDWFVPLMLDAEYAFYWNIFSNSLLARAMNRLPIFFLDYGHMARASPPLFERVARVFYVGGVPPRVDFTQPLEAGQLARQAAEQAPALHAFGDRVLRPPPPAEVIRQLLQRPG